MTGELIPTGVTYGTGRNSINDSFSGTAHMNNIELDSGGNFSGGTGGGAFYSGGTNLYTIFNSLSGSSGNLWSASTGLNSIISNNNTGNLSQANYSIIIGSGNTIDSNTGSCGAIIGGASNKITYLGGSFDSEMSNSILGGKFNEIRQGFITARRAFSVGGNRNIISGLDSGVIGGSGNTINVIGEGASIIIGGIGNTVSGLRSVMLGGEYINISSDNTTGMQIAYIDEFIDLNPQAILPPPSIGRMFFSGSPLNRIMYNTGNTDADWIII